METWLVILIAVAAAVVSASLSALYFTARLRRKVSYMIDALEDRETNFRFDEGRLFHRRLNRTLNRLRGIFDRERREIAEQEHFYGQMLDCVKTGVVVTEAGGINEGRVLYCNAAALGMLGIATFGHVRQLGNVDAGLEEVFASITPQKEMRNSFYNEKGQVTVAFTATSTMLQGKQVKIVVMNDITGDMARSEELSWNRLIRVLTHEIMNTVTPIASLSHVLSEEVEAASDSGRLDMDELRQGLGTIAASSRGLIRFVDTYRSLTRVSPPVKTAFYVRELVDNVRSLTREQVAEAGAEMTYVEKSDDILLYADSNQISQVLVNLVKNAVQAQARHVRITAGIDLAETVVIDVENDGRPISAESRDEIFVPFYTTRHDGSGIGLSLSRQIMRLHNGTISLVASEPGRTVFRLHFR